MIEGIQIQARPMLEDERPFVLATWKKELNTYRLNTSWGAGLGAREYWKLANHILDKVTLPSCEVWMGCHPDDDHTPLCWLAIRRVPGRTEYAFLWSYGRRSLHKDPELAYMIEQTLLHEVRAKRPLLETRQPFSLFNELDFA